MSTILIVKSFIPRTPSPLLVATVRDVYDAFLIGHINGTPFDNARRIKAVDIACVDCIVSDLNGS
jgi:hypothetical protein